MVNHQRLHKFIEAISVASFFIVMAIIMTWPLAQKMGDSIAGRIGDNIYFIWMVGWFRKALFELHVNPFDVWFLNYPEGWSMAYTEIAAIMVMIGIGFSYLGGITFGYNAAMLFSFAAAGVTMYIWIRHLTKSRGAALVSGMIFAFIPYHTAHFLIGHLNLSGIQWFPLYFMGLWEVLSKSYQENGLKIQYKWVLLAGISLGLIALTSTYYIFMTLFITALLVLVYILFINKKAFREKYFWINLIAVGIVSLPLVLFAIYPYFSLLGQGGLPDRNIWITRRYSASPTDFILPSTDHFLWGQWVGDHFNREMWVEGTLYIGVVTLVLAGFALIRNPAFKMDRLRRFLLWGIGISIILAMGTDLHWLSEPVEIALPAFLADLIGRPDLPIPLPGYFLFKYFPFYAKLRSLMRFGIFALLFFGVLAGFGAARIISCQKQTKRWLTAAFLTLLVFLDFYPGLFPEFAEIKARPVDYYLAEQLDRGPLVQLPFEKAEDQENTYYTLIHNKPYIGGFFNAFPPTQYTRIMPILQGFPDEASLALLNQFEVKYILVDSCCYDDMASIQSFLEANNMDFIGQFEEQYLFINQDK